MSVFDPEAQSKNISFKIIAGLERISEAFRVALWKKAKSTGLSPLQIQILLFLRYHSSEMSTTTVLANEFNVTSASISDSIKSLEKKILVVRKPSPANLRIKLVVLSPEGEKLAAEMHDFTGGMESELDGMKPQEKEICFNMILNLVISLEKKNLLSQNRICQNCQHFNEKANMHCKYYKVDLKLAELRLDCPDFRSLK